jgi:hypothetical protein
MHHSKEEQQKDDDSNNDQFGRKGSKQFPWLHSSAKIVHYESLPRSAGIFAAVAPVFISLKTENAHMA